MELKVWTDDGVSRIVSGISEFTTCKDVMVATAQVTGGVGRYCMTVCYDNVCKKLNPADRPVEVCKSLGKTYNDVKFYVNSSTKTTHKKLKTKSKIMEVHPSFPKEHSDSKFLQYKNLDQLSFTGEKRCISSTSIHHEDKKELTGEFKKNILHAGCKDKLDYECYRQENQNKNLMTMISNERIKFEETQERLELLKSETHQEEINEELETQKIKSLLKYISELQNNCNLLDKELEELELVSWNDKLEIEAAKESNLQSDLIEAKRDADSLQVQILRLDDEIAALKNQIKMEEEAKNYQETEIENMKQDFQIKKDESKKLEEQIQKLDEDATILEKNLKNGEAELVAKLNELRALQKN